MNTFSRMRSRAAVLVGAAAIMAAASLPLIGQAQDATPSDTTSDQQLIEQGEQIYANVCIACHQPDGKGIEGAYLPLNGNALVTLDDPTYLISTVLTGRGGMPTFARTYTDEEIAAISTYVRQAWENEAPAVSPEQVADVREDLLTKPLISPTPEAQIQSGIEPDAPDAVATPGATP